MKKLAIALTGHRPPKLAGYDYNNIFYKRLYKKLDNIVKQALTRYDYLELHSGMALGADVPNMEQYKKWPPNSNSKEIWLKLMKYADEVITYEDKNPGKSIGYILNARNWGMIEPCEVLIAVYNGDKTGGTANAVKYGLSKKKKIIYIHPDELR